MKNCYIYIDQHSLFIECHMLPFSLLPWKSNDLVFSFSRYRGIDVIID